MSDGKIFNNNLFNKIAIKHSLIQVDYSNKS